ncbi:hypothetical protein DW520_08635 [Escherichia coli]|nr:hypothetical protein [Escherichia coli]
MQHYIHLYLTIKYHFSDISFYWKDDRVMTVIKKLCAFSRIRRAGKSLPDAA